MSEIITPILQFGTSRFLQAHADLFFSDAAVPQHVTVVQSSGDPSRAHRLAALADEDGFPVRIRGLQNGQIVDSETRVTSVRRTLSTATDWDAVVRVACDEAQIIISNTSDTGFDPQAADNDATPNQAMSYPAKLFHILAARFHAGGKPLTIMPLELINNNGDVLKARVLDIAAQQHADADLLAWISDLVFANSLVDRIVSEPIEPAGAVAEPYALWAIQRDHGVTAPCAHPAVQLVDDLQQIERLKLHILNLGHTVLAHIWRAENLPQDTTVGDMMDGPHRAQLDAIYAEEVLPGFAAMGVTEHAGAYLAQTLERFANPFLDHKIADIAQNHSQKVDRRIGAFVRWTSGTAATMPRLHAILKAANT